MVVIDIYSRKIMNFSVEKYPIIGPQVCQMFNEILPNKKSPKRISTDHDPLFEFLRWKPNLNIEEIDEIKTVPYVPKSHPYV